MESIDLVYDFAVLGAGVEGSATAYSIASSNAVDARKVLLLEQFEVLHTRGSSHGPTRLIRRGYTKPCYVDMVTEAHQLWEATEEKSGVKLFQKTGLLHFGPKNDKELESVINCLALCGIPHEVMSSSEANQRYPDQLKLPDEYKCLSEPDAGMILSSKAVDTFQKLFVAEGGVIKDYHKVTEIQPGPVITLVTSKATFKTRHLVITAGGWSKDILSTLGLDLPLKARKVEVYYWKAKKAEDFSFEHFPGTAQYDNDCCQYYGCPAYEYPEHMKFCSISGCELTSADERDINGVGVFKDDVSFIIQKCFKGINKEPSVYDGCIITMTPDNDPILDTHPSYPNIVIGAGFSGHGFKLSPVVGKLLSQLVQGIPPSIDMEPFKIKRFI